MKKHRILDLPVIGPVLLFVYADLAILLSEAGLYQFVPEPGFYLAVCLVAILMVVIHRLWFRHEYRGGLYLKALWNKSFWRIFLILVAIDAAVCCYDIATTPFVGITAAGICSAVMAGIVEEVECRYLMISLMMRRYKNRKSYMIVLLFTSVIFGLGHYINITQPSDFWPVTVQVIITMASGFAMGAVFLRTGNIAVSMFWHFLHDFLCNLHGSAVVVNPVIEGISRGDLVECGLMFVVYIVFGILLLKGQGENIRKVWQNRWPDPENEAPGAAEGA